jgi:sugar transferase (PEP-CTERM/EpsH1 system associated)
LKILFLANRIPYPPYRGDKLKIFNLARRLQSHHELYLITFAQHKDEYQYLPELQKVFKEVHLIYLPKWRSALNCLQGIFSQTPFQVLYFQSAQMHKHLSQWLASHQLDAVHVQHLRMSPYLAGASKLPRILDLPDAFSLYWERRKTIPRGFLTRVFESIEQKRVLAFEKIMDQYNLALVCSSEDLEYLKTTHQHSNIKLLPNGIDLTTFTAQNHDYSHNHTVLFTGNMDYAPNVDAVTYFCTSIWPLIKAKHPQAKFIIAGQRPVNKVAQLANGNDIEVTGFVKDLAAMYNRASVVVAPLRFGAGTQNKVIEAMAMGIPVVCTHIGFAGLGIQSGEGVIMKKDPMDFANEVAELLQSEQKRMQVGQKGKAIAKEKFDWDIIVKQLENYFKQIANQH